MESELYCDVCGLPIDPDEDYCWGHEEDCPRREDPDAAEGCDCDLNYHEACCPECREYFESQIGAEREAECQPRSYGPRPSDWRRINEE